MTAIMNFIIRTALPIAAGVLLLASCSTTGTQSSASGDDHGGDAMAPPRIVRIVETPPQAELVAVEVIARIDANLLPDEPDAPLRSPDLLTRLSQSLVLSDSISFIRGNFDNDPA